jgi:ribonuclease T2
MRLRHLSLTLAAIFLAAIASASSASAQDKGQPGKFDFYLMNLSWSPEFCSIQGTSPECAAHPGFILHGLWTQNNDGTYPVFCSEEPAPQTSLKISTSPPTSHSSTTSGPSTAPAPASARSASSPWNTRPSTR